MSSREGEVLTDHEWNELQAIADQFAAARRNGPVDDWLPFIPAVNDRLHRPVLLELVKIDLEMAWKSGNGAFLEAYRNQFPGLDPMPAELIAEEYRVRYAHGDRPHLDEYRTRFPEEFPEAERRINDLPVELPGRSVAGTQPSVAGTQPSVSEPRPSVAEPRPSVADTQRRDTPAPPRPPDPPVASAAPDPSDGSGLPVPDGYKLIELIGRGNFGEVWKAEGPGGVDVALKIVSQPLDNEAAQREKQSLELIKKLNHPALLMTIGSWVIRNRLVIAMELADESLRDRLKRCLKTGMGGIPSHELLHIVRDTAVGLDWLHWQGVLHRDIKPENILLKKGYAKVADFGLAKGHLGHLASASMAGTPAFMAPEIFAGKAGKASDQYSLAFTYAELRLGRRPLRGEDFYQVMKNTLEGEPDLGDMPKREQEVVRRALAKQPEQRFESCREFVKALEGALGVQSVDRPFEGMPASGSGAGSGAGSSGESDSGTLATGRKLPPPKLPSGDRTQIDGTQIAEKSGPRVWKPPGPSQPTGGGGKMLVLLGMAALVVVAAVVVGLVFWKWPTSIPSSPDTGSLPPKTNPPTTPNTSVDDKPVFLPPKFAQAPGAKLVAAGGKECYEQIVYKMSDGRAVPFLLLRPSVPDDPRPFYVAVHKVTNAFFQDFMKENAGAVDAAKWKGGLPDHPVFHVTFDEAERFAKWLGAKLPTTRQWDYAAGYTRREGREGPWNGRPLGIGTNDAVPVTADAADESPMKVRNMAANGREFTADRSDARGEPVVVLRGRMFTLTRPLSYLDLEYEQKPERAQVQYPNARHRQTGFRVVIEVP